MKKKILAALMVAVMAVSLTACGNSQAGGAKEYKVGVVNYVDDASLNQIIDNLEKELGAKGTELGVTFNYADFYDNAQADTATLNQIGANMVADDVDIIVAVATNGPSPKITSDTGIIMDFSFLGTYPITKFSFINEAFVAHILISG